MKDRNILSIHNHPKGTFSPPSSGNFEILEHDFENYEIICSEDEYWILEQKSTIDKTNIEQFKLDIDLIFQNVFLKSSNPNKDYGDEITKYINSSKIISN